MSSIGTTDDFTILRLRVNGSKPDPLAVRPRVQQLISEIRLHPLLPESASLFIRKLEDPAPGLLRLDAIDSRATQNWRRSFNSRFTQLVTSAVRPARGPVSSSAESVVFLDYSELLACLTADWCNGFVGARWWWHCFLKRGDIEHVIKSLWQEKIEYAPAALQRLAKTPVLLEFVARLSDGETHQLIERLTETFGLTTIRHAFSSSPLQEAKANPVTDTSSSSMSIASKEASLRTDAPWKRVVPECDTPRLRPQQQLFVGVALMLKRAPVQVRTQSFAHEIERWQMLVSSGISELEEKKTERLESIDGPKAIEREPQISQIDTDRVVATEAVKLSELKTADTVFTETVTPQVVSTQVELPRAEEPPATNVEIDLQHVQIEPTLATPQVFAEVDESLTIETELGGLFYLVNLGIFLNLYSDFTSPVETFTDLNIWDFVALVGIELNGDQLQEDPVWSLLADLAGRDPEEEPGRDFEPPSDWLLNLQARLRQALGVDVEIDLGEIVLRHRARVTLTATHLDVFFSLADLPIEIRLSGLDRDPGWVPAAGRFIAFYFD